VQLIVFTAAAQVVAAPTGQRDGATGRYAITLESPLPDGLYFAGVRQSDSVGNEGESASIVFVVDTHAPEPTLTAPAAGRSRDTTPTLAGTGTTENGDVGSVEVRFHAGETPAGAVTATSDATLAADGSFEIDAAALPDGIYTAQGTQRDTAGNAGTTSPRTFTIDTTGPPVTLTTPAAGVRTSRLPTFAGVGGTAPGDDATVTVTVHAGGSADGAVVQTIAAPRDATSGAYAAVSPSPLADGTYTAVTTQSDDLGNSGASTARTFTVDGTVPVVDPPVVDPPGPGVTPPGPGVPPPGPRVDPPGGGVDLPRPGGDRPAPGADSQAPVLSRISLSARRFAVGRTRTATAARALPRGTTLRYTLSERAAVTIAITRAGRSAAVRTLTRRGVSGANRVAFSGRIGRKALASGRYVLTLRAVDAAGNRGAARRISFRIG
jgi:hypothetical protein